MRRQWLWATLSLVAFLPAAFYAMAVLSSMGLSSRSAAGNVLLAAVALGLPASCLIGPVLAWNLANKGKLRPARFAQASPLISLALFVVVVLLPL